MRKNLPQKDAKIGADPASTWIPLSELSRAPWIPVISMTLTDPPSKAPEGDTYLVPTGATGVWANQVGMLAQWHGEWTFAKPAEGHGISLPDGRIFELVGGTYIEKIAIDVQSGKWVYAEDTSTAVNSVVVNPVPAVTALAPGLTLRVKVKNSNTGKTRITVGDFPAMDLVRLDGSPLFDSDLVAGGIHDVVYDGTKFQLQNTSGTPQLRRNINLYVNGTIGNDANDGSANDADHAMATIQGAVNRAFSYGSSTYTVTIRVADGSYTAVAIPAPQTGPQGGPILRIIGNTTNPSTVVVNGGAGNAFAVSGPNTVTVSGIRAQTDPNGGRGFFAFQSSTLLVSQCETGDSGTAAFHASGGAELTIRDHRFAGNPGEYMYFAQLGGWIRLTGTQTIVTTIDKLSVCAEAYWCGIISTEIANFVNPEKVTAGNRYIADRNAVIDSGGRGPDFFPGVIAGVKTAGGQYQ
ncbi:DUF2793 domain-containing protein [Brucella sp. IR073]|uniref:DUF2793 domain-containing protein n=1 Tax=unclassified Brucella TaxID=2632610 RepID=UPI003B97E416